MKALKRMSEFAAALVLLLLSLTFRLRAEDTVGSVAQAATDKKPAITLDSITPTLFFTHGPEGLRQVYDVTVRNVGSAKTAELVARWQSEEALCDLDTIAAGVSKHRVCIPDVRRNMATEFVLQSGNRVHDRRTINRRPARHWVVHLVHLSHHDVGYTHLPDDVLRLHASFFDSILEYCEKTKDWPEEARFRWTVEEFFSLDAFLRTDPPAEKVEQLVRYIKGGQIEVTALFGNEILEYCSHEELVRLMYPSFAFKRRHGIEITTAVHNDIPGCTWGLASMLAGAGVKHLAVGIPAWYFRGSEATLWDQEACLSLRTPGGFWWEGPDGRRVFFWYNPWEPYRLAESSLSKQLSQWEKDGYPFDLVCLMIRGRTDNSPPSMAIAEAAKAWNAKWAYPRLVTATQGQFLAAFEEKFGERLKTLRGDLPGTDYPVCGTCTPRETALARRTTNLLLSAEKLRTASGNVSTEPLSEAYRQLLFADEHCWGGTRPVGHWQELMWNQKRAYTYRAALAAEKALELPVGAVALAEDGPHVVVFNPLSWQRSGVVQRTVAASIPHEEACREVLDFQRPFDLLDVTTGQPVPCQRTGLSYFDEPEVARPGGPTQALIFAAEDLPADGYKTYRVVPRRSPSRIPANVRVAARQLENRFWRAEFDRESGVWGRLFDKSLRRELIDREAPHGFGEVIVRQSRTGKEHLAEWNDVELVESGPVFAKYRRRGHVLGLPGLWQETVFYHALKRIDVSYRMVRDATPGLEVYVAFPLAVADPRFRFEGPGSVIEPLVDQLPGSCTDYYGVGHWADVHNDRFGAVFSPHDAPMVELGGLFPGAVSQAHHGWTYPGYGHPFLKVGELKLSHVYSLVSYSNFTTNFLNVQANEFRVCYSLGTHEGDWRKARAWRFGRGALQPPLATFVKGPQRGWLGATGSFYRLDQPNVILLTVKPAEDGRGHIARMFETEGRRTEVGFSTLAFDFRKARQTSPVEEDGRPLPVADGAVRVTIEPYGMATIRLQ